MVVCKIVTEKGHTKIEYDDNKEMRSYPVFRSRNPETEMLIVFGLKGIENRPSSHATELFDKIAGDLFGEIKNLKNESLPFCNLTDHAMEDFTYTTEQQKAH